MVTIEIRAEHIACGTCGSCANCASALAIKEATGEMDVFVGTYSMKIGNLTIDTPPNVQSFILDYDAGYGRPMTFELPIHKLEQSGGVYYGDYARLNREILDSGGKL